MARFVTIVGGAAAVLLAAAMPAHTQEVSPEFEVEEAQVVHQQHPGAGLLHSIVVTDRQ